MLQKLREISIRRVAGSGVFSTIMLFSKEFIRITFVSFIIAVPVCYYWVSEWLKAFDVKMDIGLWNFLIPFLIVLTLVLVTIGFIVKKAASVNPADNLRSE